VFAKSKLTVISEKGETDLSRASYNQDLSVVDFDSENRYFYVTIDKVMFTDPVSTIKTVLEAHGYVDNLENILSCLDSFLFAAHAKTSAGDNSENGLLRVSEYLPCIRFELPQKNKVGSILQSFYDEIAKYEARVGDDKAMQRPSDPELRNLSNIKRELTELKDENQELREQVSALTLQLSREQKSLNRASRALDSQRLLPDNAKIGRVEKVDLKRRMVQVKCQSQIIDIPTHMLDHVPEFQARCLITLDDSGNAPVGIVFFDNAELENIEQRTAELLYVEGDRFKARDSRRNEFQIKAVNDMEAATILCLRRGMKIVVSLADGFVVRFAVLGTNLADQFIYQVQEQFIVYDIARNQLVDVPVTDKAKRPI
jgi:hypothetical protein